MDLSLLNQQLANPMIVQSNRLTEARYTMSVSEQRLVTYLLSSIHPNDEDFKEYEIKITDFMEVLGITDKGTYKKINQITEALITRPIHIEKPDGNGFIKAAWLASADYDHGNGLVKLAFAPVLKPYLLQLKSEFTKYRLFVVVKFQSQYSIRIYMLLKQYESIGHRDFNLDELKEIVGLKKDSYSRFQDFKTWVLNQAKKEFERKDKAGCHLCDISFNFVPLKTGRKITGIRFIIIKQEYQEVLGLDDLYDNKDMIEINPSAGGEAQTKSIDANNSPTLAKMLALGINEKKARQLLAQHSAEFIEGKIIYTEQQDKAGKIKTDTGAFLFSAITKDWSNGAENKAKEHKEQEARRKAELKALFDAEWTKLITEKYYKEQIAERKRMLQGLPILQGLRDEAEAQHQGNHLSPSMRESAIDGAYHILIKERMIAPPKPEDLEQLRATVPPPDLSTWRGSIRISDGMKKYIKEFSNVTTKES